MSNPGIPFGVKLVAGSSPAFCHVLDERGPIERERQRPALIQVRHGVQVEPEIPGHESGGLDVGVAVLEPLDVVRRSAGAGAKTRIDLARLEGEQGGRRVLDDPCLRTARHSLRRHLRHRFHFVSVTDSSCVQPVRR